MVWVKEWGGSKFWCQWRGSKNGVDGYFGVGLNVLLYNHTLWKTLSILKNMIYLYHGHCTSRIQQALRLLFIVVNLFRISFVSMKLICAWCNFRFLKAFSLVFFLNSGYLFCLKCKTSRGEGGKKLKHPKDKEHLQ